jgi:hypothetical protein
MLRGNADGEGSAIRWRRRETTTSTEATVAGGSSVVTTTRPACLASLSGRPTASAVFRGLEHDNFLQTTYQVTGPS